MISKKVEGGYCAWSRGRLVEAWWTGSGLESVRRGSGRNRYKAQDCD